MSERLSVARRPTRPASPCISVCRIEPGSGLCEGCLRTLDEIAAWGGMSEGERLRTWDLIDHRRAARESGRPEARP